MLKYYYYSGFVRKCYSYNLTMAASENTEKDKEPLGYGNIINRPRIVEFGFNAYVVLEKENKCRGTCKACKHVITETRGTTSGFVR